ncbi:MAG: 16S rRNA (guanine(966)-N(2))-methyltransferase RsmD [Fusobacteria bacterium]|nr:16S rRNA (guanine(966)-N(2))-methyltransferase RsmD [Fusobacteriota bacterium]
MKITSGIVKNRKIKSQNSVKVRPTLSRVKESLFDIMNPYIENSVFLDLYSGTGSIALEALSRGAKRAIMIEQNVDAIKIIIENVNNMGFEDVCRAYKNDVLRAIEILSNKKEMFDIIFLDPPYNEDLCLKTVDKVCKFGLLKDTGLIIVEHHKHEKLPEEIGNVKRVDERKYSNKTLSFYSKSE